ncbi:helix-turn-helix domain-containing protein [Leeia oryzae]|uniref:helix-turn-helix domain-containing protein n=1 Tax=Leeia oryzae TaxID=356662 RepID=UPI0003A41E03|nr:XRE family transcriptional regulator [Leeia oryzae]
MHSEIHENTPQDPVWLGKQIRDLRKMRKLSLEDMQQLTGRSVGFLSQLERGKSQATVTDLSKIASVLNVPFSVFFSQAPAHERGVVVRQHQRPQLQYANGVTDELLSPGFDGGLQLMLTTFAPGASSGAQPFEHGGDESGMVIKGQLELWIGDKCYLLSAGDSFSYASDQPHRYCNPGSTDTQVIWAYTVSN